MVGKVWWPDQVVFDGGSMRQFAHFLVDQEAERDECWPLEVFLFFSFYSFQNPCLSSTLGQAFPISQFSVEVLSQKSFLFLFM